MNRIALFKSSFFRLFVTTAVAVLLIAASSAQAKVLPSAPLEPYGANLVGTRVQARILLAGTLQDVIRRQIRTRVETGEFGESELDDLDDDISEFEDEDERSEDDQSADDVSEDEQDDVSEDEADEPEFERERD